MHINTIIVRGINPPTDPLTPITIDMRVYLPGKLLQANFRVLAASSYEKKEKKRIDSFAIDKKRFCKKIDLLSSAPLYFVLVHSCLNSKSKSRFVNFSFLSVKNFLFFVF